jgi:hypothetical protein
MTDDVKPVAWAALFDDDSGEVCELFHRKEYLETWMASEDCMWDVIAAPLYTQPADDNAKTVLVTGLPRSPIHLFPGDTLHVSGYDDIMELVVALREIQKAAEDCAEADDLWPHRQNYRDFAEHARAALKKFK